MDKLEELTILQCVRVVLLLVIFITFATGCLSWHTADGTRHTLILGIGLVSTKEAPDRSATALRAHTLGLALRPPNGGLVLGYQSLHVTAIPPEWEGVIQVNSTPGQPLTVEGHAPKPQPFSPATALTQGEEHP